MPRKNVPTELCSHCQARHAHSNRLCNRCHKRWWRHGDPSVVQRVGVKHNPSWIVVFLAQYQRLGDIQQAAKLVGISRQTVYNERRRNAEFRDQLDRIHALWITHRKAAA